MSIYEWVVDQMQHNQFFGAAAFASIAAAVFAYAKGFPQWVWNRILTVTMYRVTIYQTDELYHYIMMWIRDNHKSKARNVEYVTAITDDSPELLETTSVTNGVKPIMEIPVEDFFYLRKYGRLLRIGFGRDKLENANNLKSVYLKNFTIRGFFASRSIRKLMNEINQSYGTKKRDPHFYITDDHYWRYMTALSGKPISQVVLNHELKESIMKDIQVWKNSMEDYRRRGIAFKRGHCYQGPPGTGKTTLSKALAIEHSMDVYAVNLHNVGGDDMLIRLFSNIRPNSILLFEDIDSYFNGREMLNKKGKVTFSGLLNALDGVVTLDNVLIIITTNHIEKLDAALIRPGRIDLIKELGYATSSEASEYISMFYESEIVVELKTPLAMTYIQNICLSNPNDPEKVKAELESVQQ